MDPVWQGCHPLLQAVLLAALPRAATAAFELTCPLGSGSKVTCTTQGWIVLSLILLLVLLAACAIRYCRLNRSEQAEPLEQHHAEDESVSRSAVVPSEEGALSEKEEFKPTAMVGPPDLRVETSSCAGQPPLEDSPPPCRELPADLQEGKAVAKQLAVPEVIKPDAEISEAPSIECEDYWRRELTKLTGDWDVEEDADSTDESIDVVLECVDSAGVDVELMESWQRSMVKTIRGGRVWRIGPRHQPHLFCRLVPNVAALPPPELFELALEAPCLYLRRLALDMPLLLNGVPLRQPAFVLWHEVEIGLCCMEGSAPQFTFRVLLDKSSTRSLAVALRDSRSLQEHDFRGKKLSEVPRDCLARLGFGRQEKARIVV